jgi:hypothetical protein
MRGPPGRHRPITMSIGTTPWVEFAVDLMGEQITMTGVPDDVPPLARGAAPDVRQRGYKAYPLVDHVADKVVAIFDRYGPGAGAIDAVQGPPGPGGDRESSHGGGGATASGPGLRIEPAGRESAAAVRCAGSEALGAGLRAGGAPPSYPCGRPSIGRCKPSVPSLIHCSTECNGDMGASPAPLGGIRGHCPHRSRAASADRHPCRRAGPSPAQKVRRLHADKSLTGWS